MEADLVYVRADGTAVTFRPMQSRIAEEALEPETETCEEEEEESSKLLDNIITSVQGPEFDPQYQYLRGALR